MSRRRSKYRTEIADEDAVEAIRPRKKRKKKHYLLKTFFVLLLLVGLYFLAMSDFFGIHEVGVSGNAHFEAAQIESLSGIKKGDNIFKTRMADVKDLLEKDPYINTVTVKRKFPDKVKISVTERAEDVIVRGPGTKYYIVDFLGMDIRDATELPNLPIVEGLSVTKTKPGEMLKVKDEDLYKESLEFLKNIAGEDLYFKKIVVGGVNVRAYIFDELVCEGSFENIKEGAGPIRKVIADLVAKGTLQGTINVGVHGTCSFRPGSPN
ncbi:MAG: FtsQ-type POTRA domain-containing protein [Clostridiales Family XIII bacterium]|jgi:cell division protein FtsQ|nr:FtsQ-type POTRA domain-containing protein [Clostridiales Family XIII bacterium]